MKVIRTLFILFTITSCLSLVARAGRSVKRLRSIRVGDTTDVGEYKNVTSKSLGGKVHIIKNSDGTHSISGTDEGMVTLYFYDDDDEIVLEKAIDVRPRRQESSPSVGFSIGVGGYPRGYWISSDPPYDPFYGWNYPYWRYPRRRGYYYDW